MESVENIYYYGPESVPFTKQGSVCRSFTLTLHLKNRVGRKTRERPSLKS